MAKFSQSPIFPKENLFLSAELLSQEELLRANGGWAETQIPVRRAFEGLYLTVTSHATALRSLEEVVLELLSMNQELMQAVSVVGSPNRSAQSALPRSASEFEDASLTDGNKTLDESRRWDPWARSARVPIPSNGPHVVPRSVSSGNLHQVSTTSTEDDSRHLGLARSTFLSSELNTNRLQTQNQERRGASSPERVARRLDATRSTSRSPRLASPPREAPDAHLPPDVSTHSPTPRRTDMEVLADIDHARRMQQGSAPLSAEGRLTSAADAAALVLARESTDASGPVGKALSPTPIRLLVDHVTPGAELSNYSRRMKLHAASQPISGEDAKPSGMLFAPSDDPGYGKHRFMLEKDFDTGTMRRMFVTPREGAKARSQPDDSRPLSPPARAIARLRRNYHIPNLGETSSTSESEVSMASALDDATSEIHSTQFLEPSIKQLVGSKSRASSHVSPSKALPPSQARSPSKALSSSRAGSPSKAPPSSRVGSPSRGLSSSRAGSPSNSLSSSRVGSPVRESGPLRSGSTRRSVSPMRNRSLTERRASAQARNASPPQLPARDPGRRAAPSKRSDPKVARQSKAKEGGRREPSAAQLEEELENLERANVKLKVKIAESDHESKEMAGKLKRLEEEHTVTVAKLMAKDASDQRSGVSGSGPWSVGEESLQVLEELGLNQHHKHSAEAEMDQGPGYPSETDESSTMEAAYRMLATNGRLTTESSPEFGEVPREVASTVLSDNIGSKMARATAMLAALDDTRIEEAAVVHFAEVQAKEQARASTSMSQQTPMTEARPKEGPVAGLDGTAEAVSQVEPGATSDAFARLNQQAADVLTHLDMKSTAPVPKAMQSKLRSHGTATSSEPEEDEKMKGGGRSASSEEEQPSYLDQVRARWPFDLRFQTELLGPGERTVPALTTPLETELLDQVRRCPLTRGSSKQRYLDQVSRVVPLTCAQAGYLEQHSFTWTGGRTVPAHYALEQSYLVQVGALCTRSHVEAGYLDQSADELDEMFEEGLFAVLDHGGQPERRGRHQQTLATEKVTARQRLFSGGIPTPYTHYSLHSAATGNFDARTDGVTVGETKSADALSMERPEIPKPGGGTGSLGGRSEDVAEPRQTSERSASPTPIRSLLQEVRRGVQQRAGFQEVETNREPSPLRGRERLPASVQGKLDKLLTMDPPAMMALASEWPDVMPEHPMMQDLHEAISDGLVARRASPNRERSEMSNAVSEELQNAQDAAPRSLRIRRLDPIGANMRDPSLEERERIRDERMAMEFRERMTFSGI
ncbi:hypothetical protein CYMTET_27473 [Cymbomonas tetramitiformis]|uniref:Uncharacterized protein n=1 Tax=Cymbomonas tetramitiformis TaxID=36881 RepID=A0AAE0FPP3_9CHLO|nr:hypothetical protein CYMTET_27473 [Cymbomonas tetramitiformis]